MLYIHPAQSPNVLSYRTRQAPTRLSGRSPSPHRAAQMRLVSTSAGAARRRRAAPCTPRWRLAGRASPARRARRRFKRGGPNGEPRLLPATRTSASGRAPDARYGRRRTRVIHRATARRTVTERGGTRDRRRRRVSTVYHRPRTGDLSVPAHSSRLQRGARPW